MERWQFIQSPNGGWYWLCSDVISRRTRTSTATFKTRTECIADAAGYGYNTHTTLAQGQPANSNRVPRAHQKTLQHGSKAPPQAQAQPQAQPQGQRSRRRHRNNKAR